MVLVDSSVWIDLLRNRVTSQTVILRRLLPDNEAGLTPVIYQEVLQGATTQAAFERLRDHFHTLPFLLPQHPIKTYEAAAALYARCRQRGITPRSPHDCLVARVSIEHKALLLHDDHDFQALAKVEKALKLYPI
jgi:hypothetical protein